MIVLDTNVLSELMKPAPEHTVVEWVARQPPLQLYTTALTRAEILYGIALLPASRRRTTLEQAANAMFAEDFQDRVLPFDDAATPAFARIAAHRRRTGHAISQIDAQIAAIVQTRNAGLATRNIADFTDCDIRLFNPWDGEHR